MKKRHIASSSYFVLLVVAVLLFQVVSAEQNTSVKSEDDETVARLKSEVEELRERVRNLERWRKTYPKVKFYPLDDQKRILVTGGSGFVGSHLVDRLMLEGHRVTVADNFFTGSKRNIEHWIGHPNFELITHDIVNPLYLEVG
jgi:UDP-glucuronate decarboxylase